MKIEDDLPASPEKPIDNLPQQKPSGIKIKRPVLSPEEELLESKNYTERAKQLFQYWNNLAGPIVRHRITNPLSKSCRRALENLDKIINRGYSDEDIKRAMNNYRSLLMLENLRVSSEFCGVNVGLGRFLEQTPFFKERLNKLGVSVDSWFKECLLPWEQLREKYSKEKKDTRPEVTEELQRQWRARTNKKKFTVDEENIFRVVANRVYDYFISLADFKSDTSCNNKNPETCVKFVIKYLESRSHDFNIVPGWIQGQNFLNGSMTAYLTEIGYVQEGWDDSSAKEREERIERSERARKLKEQQDREARESLIGED
jgi:adenylate kinase family enzyme